MKEISFSYEKMGTKTRFEEEAKGNPEMAYCGQRRWRQKWNKGQGSSRVVTGGKGVNGLRR